MQKNKQTIKSANLPKEITNKGIMGSSRVRALSFLTGEYVIGTVGFTPKTTTILAEEDHWLEGYRLVSHEVDPFTLMRVSSYVDSNGKTLVETDRVELQSGNASLGGRVDTNTSTGLREWYVITDTGGMVPLKDIVVNKDLKIYLTNE